MIRIFLISFLFALQARAVDYVTAAKFAERQKCLLALVERKTSEDFGGEILCVRQEGDLCGVRLFDLQSGRPISLKKIHEDLEQDFYFIKYDCQQRGIQEFLAAPVTETEDVQDIVGRIADNVAEIRYGPPNESADEPRSSPLPKDTGTPKGFPAAYQEPVNHYTVKIFYATNRKAAGRDSTGIAFSGERAVPGELSLGTAKVTIPSKHVYGALETPSMWHLEMTPDPDRHIIVKSVALSKPGEWYQDLKKTVDASSRSDLFVFIHGYNVTFEDAARRTAQMAFDLKFQGAPLLFSWPSEGKLSRYFTDEANVEWSFRILAKFLRDISEHSGAKKIHLIAHSMGNRALTNALAWLQENQASKKAPRFQHIVMAAPDVDIGLFSQLAEAIENSASSVTLYASENDRALQASMKFHKYPRLGLGGKDLLILPRIETIDASRVDKSALGHSYVSDKPTVLNDLRKLLNFDSPASQREKLQRQQRRDGAVYWTFDQPEDK